MLSDEEKKELQELINLLYNGHISQYGKRKLEAYIKKQQKEIEELKERNNPQPDCEEPIERTEEMVNMKWVNHNYINKKESEQKERKAYIKGTNDAHELCNKKWEDKIKAIIEELEIEQESNREDLKIAIDNLLFQNIDKIGNRISINMSVREILQSLLEKE